MNPIFFYFSNCTHRKNILFPHIAFKNPNSTQPLLWFGKPKVVIPYKITESELEIPSPVFRLKKDIPPPHEYQESIRKIKTALSNGDSYQINFTQPKKFEITGNPLDIYLSMREKTRPHYGIYLNQKDFQILSFSPELFFPEESSSSDEISSEFCSSAFNISSVSAFLSSIGIL